MRYVKTRRNALPSLWALVVLALCVAASLFITYRASAQSSKATAPAESGRPAASKPEDSATIQDDPTLVPDDKESADNNVTFPVDI
jgi:hypothetical protein